jgi:hypothetical protein
LEELVERTNDILPEAVRRAFVNAQGVVIRLKANQARAIVGASSITAAGVGAAPIPVPDAAVLMPVQLGMLAGITAVFGIDMNNEGAVNLIRGIVGSGGVSVAGGQCRRHAAGLRLAGRSPLAPFLGRGRHRRDGGIPAHERQRPH